MASVAPVAVSVGSARDTRERWLTAHRSKVERGAPPVPSLEGSRKPAAAARAAAAMLWRRLTAQGKGDPAVDPATRVERSPTAPPPPSLRSEVGGPSPAIDQLLGPNPSWLIDGSHERTPVLADGFCDSL